MLPKEIERLITVPVCSECNHNKGQSDDFLREALLYLAKPASEMAKDLYEGPHMSSLRKDCRKYREWRNRVIGTVVDPVTGETSPFLKVEAAPLRKSLSDIARGVLWHCEERLVPTDKGQKDSNGNQLQFFQANLVQPWVVDLFMDVFPFQSTSGYLGHAEIFQYSLWKFSADPNWMTWHFKVFGGANALIVTREIVEIFFDNPDPLQDPRIADIISEFQRSITPSLLHKIRVFQSLWRR